MQHPTTEAHGTTDEDVAHGAPLATDGPDTPGAASGADLDGIERDLADVETALERLEAGTYGLDEVTGEPLPDHVLAANPLARRVSS